MKKEILIFAMVATMSVKPMVMEATPEKVHAGIHIDDPTGPFPMSRTPALLPGIYIDGHTLSFDNLWGNYTLTLYDEEGDVAYTACLPAEMLRSLMVKYENRFCFNLQNRSGDK